MTIFRPMREGTKRRIRIFGWVIATGTLIGIIYGSLIGWAGWGQALIGGCIGAIHGFIISSCIVLMEIFAIRTTVGRKIEQAPLVLTIIIKGLTYGTVISAVELGNIGELLVLGTVSDPLICFNANFNVTPAVRGALHAGPVVAGEVGVTDEVLFSTET